MIGMTNASLSSIDSFGPKITTAVQVVIPTANFQDSQGRTGSEAVTPPFSQTINFTSGFLSGLTSDSVPIISMYVPNSITTSTIKQYEKDYGSLTKIETGGTAGSNNGSLTFYCYYRKPTQDITVTVKGVI